MRRALRWVGLFAALAALVGTARAAAQAPQGKGRAAGTRLNFPCPNCVTVAPPSYSPDKPAPLLVALHGDEGSTRVVLRIWKAPLERRSYLLLALRCPKEFGCESSFWRWRGDPAWIVAQVDALSAAYNVDPSRIYLSGWSGGSTYLGISEPLLSAKFAAINLNGGGAPPRSDACAPCKAPVYYFMGGRNPLLNFAEAARDHFKACGHDVVWDFAPGLDHAGELAAVTKGAVPERVLAWLEGKQNGCREPQSGAVGDAGAFDGGVDASAPPPVELKTEPPVRSKSTEPLPTPAGCGCRPSPAAQVSPAGALVALAIAITRRARLQRRRASSPRTARTSPPPKRAT